MRFLVMVKATERSEAGELPTKEMIAKMGAFNEELIKAGIMLAADGLAASTKGARIHYSGSKKTVTDGPFTETKELIAGFWIWEVRSKEEAIEWLLRCPFEVETNVEIRQIMSPEDYAPIFAGDSAAQSG